MKLNWKGNQRWSEDISKATILELSGDLRISIHKFVGRGDMLYTTCHKLGITQEPLNTESWEEAEEKAIRIVQEKAKTLYDLAMKINA